jgi:hypothetical protein
MIMFKEARLRLLVRESHGYYVSIKHVHVLVAQQM